MKKTLDGVALAGEELILCAIAAIREVRLAEAAGAPQAEVARLQVLADSAYDAAITYQWRMQGLDRTTLH
ncbi:hypothetical protein Q6A49_12345 [Pseudomonas sp. 22-AL-CL-001]|uniref:hypothetical protein n=1 Tax=Pseudomonas alabamensis TaxID=3064349 RepID=UPI0027125A47|nr:hypothetical protein [Pseudomonas sp. 22-AL-CL-001]MDO7911322.1 hypothetical protein [Pseudomonas sp. 22-AL-CL-001]